MTIIHPTDESQADISTLAFKKGADDCIIASIEETELITRIFNRIKQK